ncbi:unnamed protein product [Didymodactylos carnosus]|uniref:Retropepsins domain-containing protein n=1 Tax=Didymodactylos carnosus TaxID=1234261 RepID=A0A813VDV1_9BILA|nr:unnamed protein product [Didymodactylos carnosus]CAF1081743.1 unnamed protein product [Didymodactylos carnosus]CAF3627669.1 unnamed protein product [Didymodactylos carnosus]CAF3844620.1 unnamed protein product [Didymodactylos carnosus]
MWKIRTLCPTMSQSFKLTSVSQVDGSGTNNTNPLLTFIRVQVNNVPIEVIVDSGVTHSFIHKNTLARLHHPKIEQTSNTFQLANSSEMKILGYVDLQIKINHITTTVSASIVDSSCANFILGDDWITNYKVIIDKFSSRMSIPTRNGLTSTPIIQHGEDTVFRVKLANTIILNPGFNTTQAKVPISSAATVLFQPFRQLQYERPLLL